MLISPSAVGQKHLFVFLLVFVALGLWLFNSEYRDVLLRPNTHVTKPNTAAPVNPNTGSQYEELPNSSPAGSEGAKEGSKEEEHGSDKEKPSAPPAPPPPSVIPPPTNNPSRTAAFQKLQDRILQLIKVWRPSLKDKDRSHWPLYRNYLDTDYDPNRWEVFEWDDDFYVNNGIKKIREDTSEKGAVPYSPYPDYSSKEYRAQWQGEFVSCEGPRGKALNESAEDTIKAYRTLPKGFPEVAVGDANATGIDLSVCFDRYNRYGPYGYGQGEEGTIDDWKRPQVNPVWANVSWGALQDKCLMANKERYKEEARHPTVQLPSSDLPPDPKDTSRETAEGVPKPRDRTAILIRTWEGYKYTDNDLQAMRALTTETSLLSGGEYQVFLFLNVKDEHIDISDPDIHEEILQKNIPAEFHDATILWNEGILERMYPLTGDWQVYWSQFMPLQWFAREHPEFDYIWNWETDARYTGHHYSFLEQVTKFALEYPRKYMWERNQRHYFPAAHGTYEEWLKDTDHTIEEGMREKTVDPVWGPNPYDAERQKPIGPVPPTTMENDNFKWGVGEEADLITLLPIWDPTHTQWSFKDKIWNFVPGVRPHFTVEDGTDKNYGHPEFVNIPRRTYINTVSRFSRRLLNAMHLENTAGRNMQAEMWPATVALHHGLKAVYVPHPIYVDRKWPAWYMDAIFNADGGEAAQWNVRNDSAYAHDRENNYKGWSWYYNGVFAKTLYWRWLGWSIKDESFLGTVDFEQFENDGGIIEVPKTGTSSGEAAVESVHIGGHGRMCLPGMLLHPVKSVVKKT